MPASSPRDPGSIGPSWMITRARSASHGGRGRHQPHAIDAGVVGDGIAQPRVHRREAVGAAVGRVERDRQSRDPIAIVAKVDRIESPERTEEQRAGDENTSVSAVSAAMSAVVQRRSRMRPSVPRPLSRSTSPGCAPPDHRRNGARHGPATVSVAIATLSVQASGVSAT